MTSEYVALDVVIAWQDGGRQVECGLRPAAFGVRLRFLSLALDSDDCFLPAKCF